MQCTKCGKSIVPGAAFCMHCGTPVAPTPNVPAGAGQAAPAFQAATTSTSRRTTWLAAGTALCLILAIVIGLRASGFLKFGSQAPKLQSLRAEGQTPDDKILSVEGRQPDVPLLRSEGSTTPPTLDRTQKTMPADVRKWLEHLERIEKRKNDLSVKQMAQMTVLMQQMKVLGGAQDLLNDNGEDSSPSPAESTKGKFDDLRPEWNQLIQDFRSYPPPDECRPIADDFNRAVSEIPGMNSDLADILSGAGSDPAAALERVYKIQNTSTNVIDKYFGSCDDRIGDICRKYDTRKWFDIKTDVGGGMFGKLGF